MESKDLISRRGKLKMPLNSLNISCLEISFPGDGIIIPSSSPTPPSPPPTTSFAISLPVPLTSSIYPTAEIKTEMIGAVVNPMVVDKYIEAVMKLDDQQRFIFLLI